jgi:hypothetical protein
MYTQCRIFQGVDCDTDHSLVVAKLRERRSMISERETQKLDVEGFNLKTLSEVGITEDCHTKVSNVFAALEKIKLERTSPGLGEILKGCIKISPERTFTIFRSKEAA